MRPGLRAGVVAACLVTVVATGVDAAQAVPRPFPQPATADQGQQTPPAVDPQAAPAAAAQPGPAAPDDATLGVAVYPTAQFIASYDAGRGQRYYLFGVASPFADIVAYYRNVLRNRGELVYDQPPVHMFEFGRFREESMAFPPSVTVKDYTWGGAQGYLVPLPGGKSERYPTVIQIVPAVPGAR